MTSGWHHHGEGTSRPGHVDPHDRLAGNAVLQAMLDCRCEVAPPLAEIVVHVDHGDAGVRRRLAQVPEALGHPQGGAEQVLRSVPVEAVDHVDDEECGRHGGGEGKTRARRNGVRSRHGCAQRLHAPYAMLAQIESGAILVHLAEKFGEMGSICNRLKEDAGALILAEDAQLSRGQLRHLLVGDLLELGDVGLCLYPANGLAAAVVGVALVLDGGAGDDLLIGGKGSDTYVVDSALDTTVELEKKPITRRVFSPASMPRRWPAVWRNGRRSAPAATSVCWWMT